MPHKMTPAQFQSQYHNYSAKTLEEAKQEADKVNAIGIEGDRAIAFDAGIAGFCLMLETTYTYLEWLFTDITGECFNQNNLHSGDN